MKRPVLVFGDKPGVVDAVEALGFRPVLIETHNARGVADFIPLSEREAFSGRLDLAKFQPVLNENLAGIIPANEDSLIIASELRERFFPHLKGLTREQATIVRDKPLMKEKLRELGIECARFAYLQPQSTWTELVGEVGTVMLVKPRNQFSSRGMRVLRSESDFTAWKQTVRGEIDSYYVEQYLAGGAEFFCNTILRDGQVILQLTGSYDTNQLESNQICNGHALLYPALLPPELDRELRDMVLKFITGLGIRDGYCHAEVFLHDGRFKFGEIGVRLPGGWILASESFACQTSIATLFARIFTGAPTVPQDLLTVHHPVMGYHVVGKTLGQIRRLAVRPLPGWVVRHEVLMKEGQIIRPDNWEASRVAQLMFIADTREELVERSALAATLIEIDIAPEERKKASL